MSRFNVAKIEKQKTVNLAGGEAFTQSPKLELVSWLLTSFVQDKFYESADSQIGRVSSLIPKAGAEFSAKAAVYARGRFGMRSASHVIAAELAPHLSGSPLGKRFYERVVVRPDDILEVMAYHFSKKRKLTNAMRKGFGAALSGFDRYQLAKYRKQDKALSLVDAVNLCHPPHTEALQALIEGTLEAPKTWEAGLTKAGQSESKEEAKAQAWRALIQSRKLGYFALLRNLRNIEQQAPDCVPKALEMLVDPKLIKKSRVFPFRFATAYDTLNGTVSRNTLTAIQQALETSVSNVPKLPGKTLVVVDTSGSMQGQPINIASLFAAVLFKSCDSDLMQFSNDAGYLRLNHMDSLVSIRNEIVRNAYGGGTNFHSIFERASGGYDRVVILSDMQGWIGYTSPVSSFTAWRKRHKANPHVYSFDLSGYGSTMFPENRIHCLSGFSDKIFDVMEALESDKNALVNAVENVEI